MSPLKAEGRERALKVLLRLGAAVQGSAIVAVFLPHAAMDAIHRALGLGALPRETIVGYLARTESALYALQGALLLLLSTDIPRYRPVIRLIAWFMLVAGPLLLVLDLRVGMPSFWTAAEGPWLTLLGAVFLWLSAEPRQG